MGNVLLGLLLSIPALTSVLGAHLGSPRISFKTTLTGVGYITFTPLLVEGSTFPSGPTSPAGQGPSQQWWSLVLVPGFLGPYLPAHGKIPSLCLLPAPLQRCGHTICFGQ